MDSNGEAEPYRSPMMMKKQSNNFASWFLRKIAPILVVAAIAGALAGFLHSRHPQTFRGIQIAGSAIFGFMFLLYTWWAFDRPNSGYKWSILERLGIFASGLAALVLCLRLALPTMAGPFWAYVLVAFSLAFIVRPVLDHFGWKKHHGEPTDAAAATLGQLGAQDSKRSG